MGLRDLDLSEDHVFGNGFDPGVCETCPHHDTGGLMNTCGLCGCPTGRGRPMDLMGAPPESCPKLDEHAGGD